MPRWPGSNLSIISITPSTLWKTSVFTVSDPNTNCVTSYDCFYVFSIVCGHYSSWALCVGTMPCVPCVCALCLALPCLVWLLSGHFALSCVGLGLACLALPSVPCKWALRLACLVCLVWELCLALCAWFGHKALTCVPCVGIMNPKPWTLNLEPWTQNPKP